MIYEAYELETQPEWSVIFHSGRYDGFSPCDMNFFLRVTGYAFENVPRLAEDFNRGDFAPALGTEGHRSGFDSWFRTKPNREEGLHG